MGSTNQHPQTRGVTKRISRLRQRSWPRRLGFTLVEVVIVIVLLAVITAAFIPHLQTSVSDKLYSAAHVIASDMQYCRSLAITNNSPYGVAFDIANNRYEISHRGPNETLDTLPPSAFLLTTVGTGGKMIQYNKLEHPVGSQEAVKIHRVTREARNNSASLQFTGEGGLETPADAEIWLSAGQGAARRFIAVQVNHVTGDARIGSVTDADR